MICLTSGSWPTCEHDAALPATRGDKSRVTGPCRWLRVSSSRYIPIQSQLCAIACFRCSTKASIQFQVPRYTISHTDDGTQERLQLTVHLPGSTLKDVAACCRQCQARVLLTVLSTNCCCLQVLRLPQISKSPFSMTSSC